MPEPMPNREVPPSRPPAPTPDAELAHVRALIAQHRDRPDTLLPLLHGVQDALGHIPAGLVAEIAEALNRSRAEVHGVITYYRHFRSEPAGRHRIQVCRAEACRSCGAESLLAHAERVLDCPRDQTRADGAVTLESVYCLGLCASSPAIQIDDRLHAGVTPGDFDRLAAALLEPPSAAALAPDPPAAPAKAAGPPAPSAGAGPTRVWLPRDAAALAAGADAVAAALADVAARRGLDVDIVRTGSRGLLWLEPLLEVDTPQGRIAYGPVGMADVPGLLDAGALHGGAHPLRHGPAESIPFLARQQRVTLQRIGVIDPLSFDDYRRHGGWAGLAAALALEPAAIVQAVTDSGLRGRGGAGFPTGIKWRTVAQAPGSRKYVVCNADEGDSGTFSDRLLMEGDPLLLIEGMVIAGLAVGATQGYLYIRSEYPQAFETMTRAVALAEAAGFLGDNVLGSGRAFRLEPRLAAGSYVCGEETAMLESIEGRRGIVRAKPPLPALAGLFGCPTVINNVISLAAVPGILAHGAEAYRSLGIGRSRGTLPFQLAGNVRRGGLVELPFGVTLRELVFDFGGGTRSGRPVKAIQVGGPLGSYVPPSQWDVPIDYEAWAAMGAVVGHGGIVVHDDQADMAQLARYAMEFCALESCGKCTPCRIGSTRGVEVIDRLVAAPARDARDRQVSLLRDLCDTMVHGSLCAMGSMTPLPVLSALDHYPQDFGMPPGGTAS
jgi:formate dehydrogenase iron-sulfur subunit